MQGFVIGAFFSLANPLNLLDFTKTRFPDAESGASKNTIAGREGRNAYSQDTWSGVITSCMR